MRVLFSVALLALLAVAALATPSSLSFKVGDFFSYTFSSQVSTGTQLAQGALSTMTGTVEIQCQQILKNGNFYFGTPPSWRRLFSPLFALPTNAHFPKASGIHLRYFTLFIY